MEIGGSWTSSLVLSPVGLALVQGDLQGELRWEQLRDVQLVSKPRFFQMGQENVRTGIWLRVEGAQIVIADIYDRPLPIIFERIKAYWR